MLQILCISLLLVVASSNPTDQKDVEIVAVDEKHGKVYKLAHTLLRPITNHERVLTSSSLLIYCLLISAFIIFIYLCITCIFYKIDESPRKLGRAISPHTMDLADLKSIEIDANSDITLKDIKFKNIETDAKVDDIPVPI